MDIKELQTFIALAEQKNYLTVSVQLNYAPSTLSKHIQLLERELGVKIVRRSGRRITLTEDGEKFLQYAKRMVATYYDSIEAFSETAALRESIGVAGCEMSVSADLVPFFAEFSQRYPDIHFDMQTSANVRIPEWLRQNTVDLGFLFALEIVPVAGCRITPLYGEPVYVMTTPDNPLAKRESLALADLQGQKFAYTHESCCIGSEFRRRLARSGVHPAASLFLSGLGVTLDYARRNDGVLIVPRLSVRRYEENEGLIALPIRDEPVFAWMLAVTRDDGMLSPGGRVLLREAVRFAKRATEEYPDVVLPQM